MSQDSLQNLLLEDIEYQVRETEFGAWRRYLYPTGQLFEEFVSHQHILGMPLLHYTRGVCPETGKRITARGIIAIGRLAVGIIAIGHASIGVIALGQAGFGVLLGLGQLSTGLCAVGQLSLAVLFGLGQFTTGFVAIGQFAFGYYALAQIGGGRYVWDMFRTAPEAQEFFRSYFL